MTAHPKFIFKVKKTDKCQHVIEYAGASYGRELNTKTVYGFCSLCGQQWKGKAFDKDIRELGAVELIDVEELV